jgi:hypothetical protein
MLPFPLPFPFPFAFPLCALADKQKGKRALQHHIETYPRRPMLSRTMLENQNASHKSTLTLTLTLTLTPPSSFPID